MNRRSWGDGKKLDKKDGGYQWLYYTKRWRMHRLNQLRKHPLCAHCLDENYVKAAQVVHHLVDHKGDYHLFFNTPLQSLCKKHHDNIRYGMKAIVGCDVSGKPYRTTEIFIDHNKINAGGHRII